MAISSYAGAAAAGAAGARFDSAGPSTQRTVPRRSCRRIVAGAYKEPQTDSFVLQSAASTSYPLVHSSRFGSRLQSNFSLPELCSATKTLDEMIQSVIVEIVKNLKEAPFLHFVFDSSSCKSRRQTLPGDLTGQECWNFVRLSVLDLEPEGLIFVQKLDEQTSKSVRQAKAISGSTGEAVVESRAAAGCTLEQQVDGLCPYRSKAGSAQLKMEDSASNDLWGVLVQGKHGSACYILQTTRVFCAGISTACTRFCLAKAKTFGPSVQAQLENLWLI